jgi:hypothetical protein
MRARRCETPTAEVELLLFLQLLTRLVSLYASTPVSYTHSSCDAAVATTPTHQSTPVTPSSLRLSSYSRPSNRLSTPGAGRVFCGKSGSTLLAPQRLATDCCDPQTLGTAGHCGNVVTKNREHGSLNDVAAARARYNPHQPFLLQPHGRIDLDVRRRLPRLLQSRAVHTYCYRCSTFALPALSATTDRIGNRRLGSSVSRGMACNRGEVSELTALTPTANIGPS